jgi:hypothetical protein
MHWIWIALITNMAPTFAACVVSFIAGVVIILCVWRTTRASEVARVAREDVRTQEMNQLNARLASLENHYATRITFLEGKLQGQSPRNLGDVT